MNLEKGFIKLYRSLLDWEWYSDTNTFRLFTHCLLRANYQDTKWKGLTIKRGSFVTSLNTLVEETHLSVQNIRTSIDKLKSTGELTSKSHSKYRIVTVNNYHLYQETNKQTNKQLTTDKELKKSNTTTTTENVPFKKIVASWNKTNELRPIRALSEPRKTAIRKVYNIDNGITFKEIVSKAINSEYLHSPESIAKYGLPSIDFIMKPKIYEEILEGGYQ
jgi:type I site-specific restriction endonuclease